MSDVAGVVRLFYSLRLAAQYVVLRCAWGLSVRDTEAKLGVWAPSRAPVPPRPEPLSPRAGSGSGCGGGGGEGGSKGKAREEEEEGESGNK